MNIKFLSHKSDDNKNYIGLHKTMQKNFSALTITLDLLLILSLTKMIYGNKIGFVNPPFVAI